MSVDPIGARRALTAVVLAVLVLLGAVPADASAVTGPDHAPTFARTGSSGSSSAPVAATPPSATASTPSTGVQARVAGLSPVVAVPGRDVDVTIDLVNPTASAAAPRRVEVRVGSSATMRTRAQIRAFAATRGRSADPVVVDAPVTGGLAPKGTARVALTIPHESLRLDGAYGVLPITVDVTGSKAVDRDRVATYLPYQVRKEYQPLSLAFAVPLTLDPNPDLVTGTGERRTRAWSAAVGPQSRLARIVAATTGRPVTWAIDPSIVGAGSAEDEDVDALQRDLASRIHDAAGSRDVFSLPPGDPDLVELSGTQAGRDVLSRSASVQDGLGEALGISRIARLAWPVGGPLSASGLDAVAQAFGTTGPAAVLSPGSALGADAEAGGPAARRLPTGRAVLGYDDELSRLFSQMAGSRSVSAATSASGPVPRPATPAEGAQRFLAETAALLGQSPGRARSVLVAAARDLDPDPAAMTGLMTAVSQTPWLTTTTTRNLVAAAGRSGTPTVTATATGLDPLSPGASPVDAEDVGRITQAARTTAGLAQVLPTAAAATGVLLPDAATLRALLSTRWRTSPSAFTTADRAVGARIDTLTSGVSVVPSTVNFFADHGVLQITVVNDLDVEVHDVRLVVQPQGRPPRLQVTAPPSPLRISPHSRTTVRLQVEAIAAGVVPIATHVETPSGTRLGTDAPVRVRVQPTNGWLMLALGGLVGVVFLAGLYRALRAGSPRVSSEDLKEIDLE